MRPVTVLLPRFLLQEEKVTERRMNDGLEMNDGLLIGLIPALILCIPHLYPICLSALSVKMSSPALTNAVPLVCSTAKEQSRGEHTRGVLTPPFSGGARSRERHR